jgi:hypothetical protein
MYPGERDFGLLREWKEAASISSIKNYMPRTLIAPYLLPIH